MDPITIALGLAQFAPMVAGWIAGPKAEANAQKAIDIAKKVLPGTPDDQLAAAFAANPDKALEFQKLASDQHTAMMNAVLADIQDARKTMVGLAGMGSRLAWGAAVVSALIVITNAVMGYMIFAGEIPPSNRETAMLYVGNMLGALSAVVAFWLGSSMSSVQKTDMIRR